MYLTNPTLSPETKARQQAREARLRGRPLEPWQIQKLAFDHTYPATGVYRDAMLDDDEYLNAFACDGEKY